MDVPLLDLQTQYLSIKNELQTAVEEVLAGGRYILGPNVSALEEELATYCGVKAGVGVASGTDALELSLAAAGVGPGDDVITTPFTYVATTETILRVGARPVFADIDPVTFNLDPDLIESVVTERTRAIVPVDLYGQVCDYGRIRAIARTHGLKIIEDAAQACGAVYRPPLGTGEATGNDAGAAKAGSLGDVGCLSFFPTKNLGAYGDGGMVLTSDSGVAKMVRSLRVHGSGQEQYIYALRGKNSRLDELQAAILRVKYRHLDEWVAARRENARRYSSLLQEAGVPVQPPKEASYAVHAFGVYTVRAEQRDELEQHLKSRGIGCRVYYPIALHLQKAYRELGYHEGMFPVAERACREVLSLPIYPELSEEMLQYVVREIAWFYCA